MFFFINIPQTVLATRVQGFNAIIEVLAASDIPIGIAVFKTLGFWYNRDGQLVASMAEDWKSKKTHKELQIMWENARLSKIMSIVVISLAEGTTISHFIMNIFILTKQSIKKDNITDNLRPMYFNAKFFYDVQKSPQYEITWVFQCFSSIFSASCFSAIDAFFAVLVLHLCGQLNNLREHLKRLPKNVALGSEGFVHMFTTVVKRHRNLSRCIQSYASGSNIVAYSIVLCIQGYQLVLITTSEDGIPIGELFFMLFFNSCFIFSLFIYCYVAEILRTESMALSDAAYESNWYNLSSLEKKLLIFTMIHAKQPFKITAGKFAAFSLSLYCSILKSSGGYLSMLLAMRDRIIS